MGHDNSSLISIRTPIFELNEFPLVSVIVPAYNAQRYIGATLKSLIRQTYPHLEIIIVDDGSRDKTIEIVKDAMIKDKRIKLFQQPNLGVAAARNQGIRQSMGSFIAPVDSDDICFSEKIAKLLESLQNTGKNSGVAYSWSVTINKFGEFVSTDDMVDFEGDVFGNLLISNFIGNASSALIRKKCFDEVGLYNPTFFSQKAQGCEDYDLYLRIAEKFDFRVVKAFLTGYRKTGDSMSDDYMAMERSIKRVIEDQKTRNPWLPDVVFNWTSAYFFLWFSSIAYKKRCYYDSIYYLIMAAIFDPLITRSTQYHQRLKSRLKAIFKKKFLINTTYNRKMCIQNIQWPVIPKIIFYNSLSEIKCGINPKKISLNLLKEKRRKMVIKLVQKAKIKNAHLA